MFKINNLFAIIALMIAPVALASELSSTGEFLDGIAAIVDDGVVLKSQVTEQSVHRNRISRCHLQLNYASSCLSA